MTASIIITLRETLEASLVVGIVLTYLNTIGQNNQRQWVWRGVYGGIITSAILAILFHVVFGGFTGRAEEIYEGAIMLFAAALITWMIVWMLKQKNMIRQSIESEVERHIEQEHPVGIFFLVFLSVVREGIETVIFMHAAYLQASSVSSQFIGGALGIIAAIIISFLFFKGMGSLSMKRCFSVTSVLLILFAAGLFAHGVHELQEAQLLPIAIEHVWDINPTVVTEGVYPALHENGSIGSILKGVFGYNGNPSLLEVLSYIAYLAFISLAWMRLSPKKRITK